MYSERLVNVQALLPTSSVRGLECPLVRRSTRRDRNELERQVS
jgi:hypothetical protein